MVDGDVEPDDRAIAPADEGRLVELEEIHHGEHVGGHQVVADRFAAACAAAVPAAIHHDHLAAARQRWNEVPPIVGIGEPAMEQDDRLPPPGHPAPYPHAVHRRVTPPYRG